MSKRIVQFLATSINNIFNSYENIMYARVILIIA